MALAAIAPVHAADNQTGQPTDRRAVGGPVIIGPAGAVDSATQRTLLDLMQQLEQLQAEVRSLRDASEVQRHDFDSQQTRSRDLNADFDRRLREMETRASTPPATVGAAAPADAPPRSTVQTEEYEAAFGLMKEGKYDRAINAFRAFVEKYPDSTYADNAQYWIGEAWSARGDDVRARTAFEAVVKRFPDGDAAKLAAERLEKLKREQPVAKKPAAAGKKKSN